MSRQQCERSLGIHRSDLVVGTKVGQVRQHEFVNGAVRADHLAENAWEKAREEW